MIWRFGDVDRYRAQCRAVQALAVLMRRGLSEGLPCLEWKVTEIGVLVGRPQQGRPADDFSEEVVPAERAWEAWRAFLRTSRTSDYVTGVAPSRHLVARGEFQVQPNPAVHVLILAEIPVDDPDPESDGSSTSWRSGQVGAAGRGGVS